MRFLFVSLCLFAMLPPVFAQSSPDGAALVKRLQQRYPAQSFGGTWVYVQSSVQQAFVFKGSQLVANYPISTAKAGLGSRSGSNQTPTGLHRVKSRFGDNVPEGGILKARAYTGQQAEIHHDPVWRETDLVTTRILWLEGLEPGINKGKAADGHSVDSYGRYIYFHGTPEEGMIGKPASHGCVRMLNRDVVALYAQTAIGTLVFIE